MQGRMLADEYGYAWISTGEILRVLITGKRRQEMLEGKLLSDQEMVGIIERVLELINVNDEFVLDGFPRTVTQAEWLLNQVKLGRLEMTSVFHLTASKAVVESRLKERGRQDDTKGAIKARFDEFESITKPILQHFAQVGVPVCDIKADETPRNVHSQIVNHLKKIQQKSERQGVHETKNS